MHIRIQTSVLVFLVAALGSMQLPAQNTSFTFQGLLGEAGSPAAGYYDFRFAVHDAPVGGSLVGTAQTNYGIWVTNGLFTATLDFGAGAFNGADRWLEIAVATNGVSPFTTLLPRQPITATPYALLSLSANAVAPGTISDAMLAPSLSMDLARLSGSQVFDGGLEATSVQINGTNPLVTTSGAALEVSGGGLLPLLEATFIGSAVEGTNGLTNLASAFPIAVDGTDVFVPAFYDHSVTWISMADPANPVQVTTIVDDNLVDTNSPFTRLGNPRFVALSGPDVYIAANSAVTIARRSGTSLLKIAEVHDNVAPFNRLSGPNSIFVAGTNAFIAGEHSLTIMDVSDPSNPVLLSEITDDSLSPGSSFTNLAGANHVVVSGSIALVTALNDDALNLIDVSDPTNPVFLGAAVDDSQQPGSPFTRLSGATHVAVHDQTALVTSGAFGGGESSITLIDISTPSDPQLLSVVQDTFQDSASPFRIRTPWDVKVLSLPPYTFAIFTSYSDSTVNFLEISNPSQPRPARFQRNGWDGFEHLNGAGGMALVGSRLYVAGYDAGAVTVMDLAPAHLGIEADWVGIGTTNPMERLHVEGNLLASGLVTARQVLGDSLRARNPNNPVAEVNLSWQNDVARIRIGGSGGTTSGAGNGLDIQTIGNESLMRLKGNGNVGIGTTNPLERLHIQGNLLATGTIRTDTIQNNGSLLNVGTTDDQPFHLSVNNQAALRLAYATDADGLVTVNLIGGYEGNAVSNGVAGATIGGGGTATNENQVEADFGTVGGGLGNYSSGFAGTIAGGSGNNVGGPGASVGGGYFNQALRQLTTIGGGYLNRATNFEATVGGGYRNVAGGRRSFVGGGEINITTNNYATVGGGFRNAAGAYAVVAGGRQNVASQVGAAVAGGYNNRALGEYAAIAGGNFNVAIGPNAMIPGGRSNQATNLAFAAGFRARAIHEGAFVWADSTDAIFTSTSSNQFLIRAGGGVGIGTTAPEADLHVRGAGSTGMLTVTPNISDSRSQLLLTENQTASIGFIMRYAGELGNNPLHFIPLVSDVENPPVMTIERFGNVGIGVANPATALDVNGTITATGLDVNGTITATALQGDGSGLTGLPNPHSLDAADGSPVNALFVDNTGQVGIGTTAPEADLHVQGAGSTGLLTITPGVSDSSSQLYLTENTSATTGFIMRYAGDLGNNPLHLIPVVSGVESPPVMTIERLGDVGIGETAPGARLDVRQADNRVALFNRTGSDGVLVNWQRDGFNQGSISVAGGVVSYNAFTGSHYAWTRENIEHGALVSLTGRNQRQNGPRSEIIYGIKLAQSPNDPRCLGAYLGLEEPARPFALDNPHQVMAVGNGEMWVTAGAAGNINPGDYLIASDVPGCAMKHDPARYPVGYIVARAGQPVDWQKIPAGADGYKRVKLSVFFESFVRDSRAATQATDIAQLRAELDDLRKQVTRLRRELHGVAGEVAAAE